LRWAVTDQVVELGGVKVMPMLLDLECGFYCDLGGCGRGVRDSEDNSGQVLGGKI
tara:strand:- start:158 stop:322 length:165 start_codon:yes stop_codon:yes gene_type:complete